MPTMAPLSEQHHASAPQAAVATDDLLNDSLPVFCHKFIIFLWQVQYSSLLILSFSIRNFSIRCS